MQKENRRKRLDVQESSLRALGKFRPGRLLPNQISQQSLVILHSETIACTTPDKPRGRGEREHMSQQFSEFEVKRLLLIWRLIFGL